jgi:hypothetical protein
VNRKSIGRPCSACSSPHRKEIERRIRSGTPYTDVELWLASVGAPIGRTALSRHAAAHGLGIARRPGPRPISASFLRDVVSTAHEDMAAGELRPSIRDAIASTVELNRQSDREQDRDLMHQMAQILGGAIPHVRVLPGDPTYTDMDAERDADDAEFTLLLEGKSTSDPEVVEAMERSRLAGEAVEAKKEKR